MNRLLRNFSLAILAVAAALLTASPALATPGTRAFDQAMKPVAAQYLKMHDALASDSQKGVRSAAKALLKATKALSMAKVTGEHSAHYQGLSAKMAAAAKTLAGAKNLESARKTFKALSKPVAMWVTMSKPKGLSVMFCSMAKSSWVQKVGKVRNPYFGASMLDCGKVVGGSSADGPKHDHGKAHAH